MLQNSILGKPKWGAQAVVRGARPSGPPRCNGTDFSFIDIDKLQVEFHVLIELIPITAP